MKKILSILSGIALLAVASFSHAGLISITDTVYQSEYVSGFLDSHSYTHDINDDGFNPDSDTVVSGNITINVTDDSRRDWFEIVVFQVEEIDMDTGGWSFGSSFFGDLEVNALGALNDDGMLDVKITSLSGDFYVGNSVLSVFVDEATNVPEPAALLLMSLGLVGVGFARKAKA